MTSNKDELLKELPDAMNYARAVACKHDRLELADEVAGLAQMKAIRSIHTFKGGNMAAWLRTIANTSWIDTLNRHKNDPEQYPIDDNGNMMPDVEEKASVDVRTPDEIMQEIENRNQTHADIMHALSTMKKPFRDVLIMYAYGYKYDDIAKKLDINIGTVMSRLSRARKHMKDNMPSYYANGRRLVKKK